MKLTLFLLLLSFLGAMSSESYSQTKISLDLKNATVRDALDAIESQSEFFFLYSEKIIDVNRKVSVDVQQSTVDKILDKIFVDTNVIYTVKDRQIVLTTPEVSRLASASDGSQQQKTISGKVTDATGGTLPGVSVIVKGTTVGIITNMDGKYTLNVPVNAKVLIFSFVGMNTQEVNIDDRKTVNVALSDANTQLEEVVAIGYGTMKKKDLTGSVASIGSKEIKDIPVFSVDQKLIGQVAGMQVGAATGIPGGGTSIVIRGAGSIGAGNQPLFVIDGFPVTNSFGQITNPLNLVNSDDIESITVLKDASSTAIYGSRGSNGVVIVTTKKGRSGAPKVEISTYQGFQQVPMKGRPGVLNGTEYAQYQKEWITDMRTFQGLTTTDSDIPAYLRNPSQYGEGTNWYNEILRTAPQNSVNASVNGGSDNFRYSVSLGHLNQEGVVRYTGFERYSVRMNFDMNLSKKLKVGLMLSPTSNAQRLSDAEGSLYSTNYNENARDNVIVRSLWMSPLVSVTDANGKRTPFIDGGGRSVPNPLDKLEFAGTKKKNLQGLGVLYAEYEIFSGLKAKYSINVNYNSGSSFVFNPSFVGGIYLPPPVVPVSNSTYFSSFNWLSEALLSYNKVFKGIHSVDAVLGYTAQHERSDFMLIKADGYPDDLVQTINAASIIPSYNQTVEQWSLISYLARVNYSYKSKYIFTATYRADGSSRFGPNNRYGYFPSAALGWKVSDEDFIKRIKCISDLKLRSSYGLTGNYNIGNYTWMANVGANNAVFGGQVAGGRALTSLNNSDLTWEKSNQFDAGFDLGLFNNKVFFTADFYNKITNSMLLNTEIPLSSGYTNAIFNLGKVRNRGVEFSLNTHNFTGKFNWNTFANISFNRNIVLALNDQNKPIYSGRSGEGGYTHKTEVGQPIGQFFGYQILGIYKDAADLANSPKNSTSVIGSIKYKDVDGNGIIEQNKDFTVIGHCQPDFTWGLTNNFSYKSISLSIILVGVQGSQILRSANETFTNNEGTAYPGQFNLDRVYVMNRWRSASQPGDGMHPTTTGARVMWRDVNSAWVEDASYVRLQNVTLSYNLNPKILTFTKVIKAANIYISGQNLAILTNYSWGNPDAIRNSLAGNTTTQSLVPAADYGNYPLARAINIGCNITF